MGKSASSRFLECFDRILFILACNYDMNENLDGFELWPDSTTELAAPEYMKKYPIDLLWLKRCHHIFSTIFNWIIFIFAGNEDMRKRLDEFEIRPDATTGFHGKR